MDGCGENKTGGITLAPVAKARILHSVEGPTCSKTKKSKQTPRKRMRMYHAIPLS